MRVLAVGNMYPPEPSRGLRAGLALGDSPPARCRRAARALTTDFRTGSAEADEANVSRELQWYWKDHGWPRIGWRGRIAPERRNADVLERHLHEFAPDVVSWWSIGGMSLGLIERVRRRGLPAVGFVVDDWLLYAPRVDRSTRLFGRGDPLAPLASLAEPATGLPARVDLDAAAR